jgi:prefoldin beta subunit
MNLDAEVKEYQALQKSSSRSFFSSSKAAGLQTLHSAKTKYLAQLNENQVVKKELDELEEGAQVFKLFGPVLLRQDKEEAQANVQKRMEFIENEVYVVTSWPKLTPQEKNRATERRCLKKI